MADVFLRRGEATPKDVRLDDPTAPPPAGTTVNINLTGLGLSTRGRVADGAVTGVAASPNVTVGISGFGLTLAQGTLSESGGATVSTSGLGLSAALGTPAVSGTAVVTLSGLGLTSALGTPAVSIAANPSLTGIGLTSALGTLTETGTAIVTLAGQELTSAIGVVTASGGGSADVNTVPTGLDLVTGLGVLSVSTGQQPAASGGRGIHLVRRPRKSVKVAVLGLAVKAEAGQVVATGIIDISDEDLLLILMILDDDDDVVEYVIEYNDVA